MQDPNKMLAVERHALLTFGEAAQTLSALARRYRQAAGQAFAEGNDEFAAAFRAAAERVDALARELPALPKLLR